MSDTVGVMTEIVPVMSQVKCIYCRHTGCGFIYRGCDVISRVVWWHKDRVWCYISGVMLYIVHMMSRRRCVWCLTKVGEMSVETVWWHRYSGCDVWYRGWVVMPEVDVTSQILFFGVIEGVHCHLQCKGYHTYAECCVINTVLWCHT